MAGLPATEWSLPFDGDAPKILQPAVDRVVALVRQLQLPGGPATMAAPDRPRVVTILGERGTGKSTALQFALHELSRHPHYHVLPVIDPDGFARGDSLGGWALAHLHHGLSDPEKAHLLSDDQTLAGKIEELSRIQSVRSGDFLAGLESRGLTFEDFTRDAVKVPYRNIAMGEEWARLIDGLAAAKGQSGLQVIIAIDDADMSPEALPGIVKDAQMLGASPRVVIFFAGAESTLRQALEIGLVADHGLIAGDALTHQLLSPRDVRSLVERKLVKNFPRSLRVNLPPLGPAGRLDFTPLGHSSSLGDLLASFPIEAPGLSRLLDLFVIRSESGEILEPSEYAQALSDNARDLRQLHEALEGEAERAEADPKVGSRALEHILQHGFEAVQDTLPRRAETPWVIESTPDGPRIEFQLRNIVFGKSQSAGTLVYRPPEDLDENPLMAKEALVARPDDGHYSVYEESDDSSQPGIEDTRLVPQFTYLTFLGWEAAQEDASGHSLLLKGPVIRSVMSPGGPSWRSQISMLGHERYVAYWTVPDWDTIYDYFIFSTGWQRVQGLTRNIDLASGDIRWVEFLLLSHIRLILSAQRSRRLPDDIAHLDARTLSGMFEQEGWEETKARYMGEIEETVDSLLLPDRTEGSIRDRDFRYWFERLFPLLASRLFTTEEIANWLLGVWQARVEERYRHAATNHLAEQTSRNLKGISAEADLELLCRLDERRGAQLREVRDQLERAEVASHASLLNQLANAGVPPDLMESISVSGTTREVLIRLVASGVPTELVARVAEYFPPPPAVRDESVHTSQEE
jgi:hypothetical protein